MKGERVGIPMSAEPQVREAFGPSLIMITELVGEMLGGACMDRSVFDPTDLLLEVNALAWDLRLQLGLHANKELETEADESTGAPGAEQDGAEVES